MSDEIGSNSQHVDAVTSAVERQIRLIAENKKVCMFGSTTEQLDAEEPRYKLEIVGPERLVKKLMDLILDET